MESSKKLHELCLALERSINEMDGTSGKKRVSVVFNIERPVEGKLKNLNVRGYTSLLSLDISVDDIIIIHDSFSIGKEGYIYAENLLSARVIERVFCTGFVQIKEYLENSRSYKK